MPLHLLKLCVGCDSIGDLEAWIAAKTKARRGKAGEHIHVTRMVPKRMDELLRGGSLYWVIRGMIACRQRLQAVRPFLDRDVRRCALVLAPEVVPVEPRPMRAFQGWRYLTAADAPPDIVVGAAFHDLPEALRRELRDLGLL
ncbi:MAG: DUF1489 domain-containing protein [Xanthobacteraceae bacterium]